MAKPPRTSSPPTSPDASADHGRLIDEAMQVMSQGRDAAPLYAFVGGLCARLGFPYYSFFIADPMNPGRGSAVDPMIATTYPDAWRTHYISHGFQEHDPVLSAGGSVRRPFTWGDRTFLHGLKGRPRRVIEDARHFGIHSGLSIPIYGPGGDKGVFTVATDEEGAAFAATVRENLPTIHLVAHQLHAAMVERLLPQEMPDNITLTEQEKICLLWTLRGKTSWEIAQIIGRSTPAVNFHLQKVMRKFGTSQKSHAAFVALRAGLI
jgi:LuxR family transcriptional activator of conjugal transfer of Ti plasmids